jgi:acyl-coenzyme A thioesterase PaaI-like protein
MPSSDPVARLLDLWTRLAPLPGGRRLFSWIAGRAVPYSGTIRPRVLEWRAGRARVALHDRRRVRNHLRSVHAVALTNLGELASGLALVAGLEPGVQAIVTRLETRFHRKARGRLVAEGSAEVAPVARECERPAHAVIRDAEGRLVAEVEATWRLRPRAGSDR